MEGESEQDREVRGKSVDHRDKERVRREEKRRDR